MDRKRFADLLERHMKGQISENEKSELAALMERLDIGEQSELFDSESHIIPENNIPEKRKASLLDRIEKQVHQQKKGKSVIKQLSKSPLVKFAAVFVLFFSLAFWWFNIKQDNAEKNENAVNAQFLDSDILLDTDNLPSLRLPNGQVHIIKEDDTKLQKMGITIAKDKEGMLCYQLQDRKASNDLIGESSNFIFTSPRGRISKVLLQDGTVVWLNSGSSLAYPSSFPARERRVSLHGEGYFEVAHNALEPFFVQVDKTTIRVLGTTFNVSAYEDDPRSVTTLLNGSVRLSSQKKQLTLRPGDQVITSNRDGSMEKQRVNVEDFTTWKQGYFNFSDQTIPEILNVIRRWYAIDDIDYQVYSAEHFTGTFKQTKSLRSLLSKLEKISDVKFQIKERRIVVMKK